MSRLRATLAALAALTFVAGCGGSSGGSTYNSAKDVASAAGCTSYRHTPGSQAEMFTADSGGCKLGGDGLTVDWFKDAKSLDNFRKVASQFGGSTILYGKNWAIECVDNSADCKKVKAKLGGTLG